VIDDDRATDARTVHRREQSLEEDGWGKRLGLHQWDRLLAHGTFVADRAEGFRSHVLFPSCAGPLDGGMEIIARGRSAIGLLVGLEDLVKAAAQ
jgi:hypothetical protein